MHGYQAHEAVTSDVKMYFKMVVVALLVGLLVQVIILAVVARESFSRRFEYHLPSGRVFRLPAAALLKYHLPAFRLFGRENKVLIPTELKPFFPDRFTVPQTEYRAVLDRFFGADIRGFGRDLARGFWLSLFAYCLSAAYILFFLHAAGRMTDSKFLRGAFKVPLPRLQQILREAVRREGGAGHLCICGLPLPRDLETKHILIMGTTGTGKSVLFNQIVGQILDRGRRGRTREKMVIYDVKGEFLSKHYDPDSDRIFYPFDARSLHWSFFNEIRTGPDFEIISKIIFQAAKETRADPFWNNAAKDVFVAGLRFLRQEGATTNGDIWSFFSLGLEDIIRHLKTLPIEDRGALKHIESKGSGPAASVISTLTEKIGFFRYLVGLDGEFSFRDYIRQPGGGNLFLLNIKNYAETFRPLMTFAFDVMIRETLSLPDTNKQENRRIWFCIDEIGSLDQISVLFDLLTVGRSKGGCMVVANQDLGKIEDVYGRPNKMTFYNNFNTGFFLRLNDPDTAEFLSRSIGEREIIKRMEGRQLSPKDYGDRKTINDQDKIEKLMLPSEFMHIPDFRAIVKFSAYGVSEVEIPREFYEVRGEHFVDGSGGPFLLSINL
ncbi:MAG TPA: type IV secretion system DNA-binding domain-containing protein [Candidatus Cloacimonadota bacterium]|nr:type IV secretion system DNA-binding domain-containing protein [Candidatus Cloacimonadota bacterium]HQG93361.1 type IV secretion system DNA-binding domain-containing protein [Acidobacteriota bacterium]